MAAFQRLKIVVLNLLLSDGVDAPFRRHGNVPCWRCRQRQERKGASMERVSMIGIDLAKNSFQAHGARADGSVAFRRKLSRAKILDFMASQPRCTVVMEACASAHYWGREIGGLGHAVRLIPPVYVRVAGCDLRSPLPAPQGSVAHRSAGRSRSPARGSLPWTTGTSYHRARSTLLRRRAGT